MYVRRSHPKNCPKSQTLQEIEIAWDRHVCMCGIRWAEPPKKRAKTGPGRPRKIQRETEVEVIEIDQESDKSDGDGYT